MENSNKPNKKRSLKVYGRYVSKGNKFSEINPEIRLSGKWVKNWGFKNGSTITVSSFENGIMIISEGLRCPPIIYL